MASFGFDGFTVVRLNFRVWSGTTQLNPEDCGMTEQTAPSESWAKLGNKRLLPLSSLTPFNTLRQQGHRLIQKFGTGILGKGMYLVPNRDMVEVANGLDQLVVKFHDQLDLFIANYWASAQDQYNAIVAAETAKGVPATEAERTALAVYNAVPDPAWARGQFRARWLRFAIDPGDNNVAEELVEDVSSSSFAGIRAKATELLKTANATEARGEAFVKRASVDVLSDLAAKVKSFSTFVPSLWAFAEGVDRLASDGSFDGPQGFAIYKALLRAMASPDFARDCTAAEKEAVFDPTTLYRGFIEGAPVPVCEPDPVPAPADNGDSLWEQAVKIAADQPLLEAVDDNGTLSVRAVDLTKEEAVEPTSAPAPAPAPDQPTLGIFEGLF